MQAEGLPKGYPSPFPAFPDFQPTALSYGMRIVSGGSRNSGMQQQRYGLHSVSTKSRQSPALLSQDSALSTVNFLEAAGSEAVQEGTASFQLVCTSLLFPLVQSLHCLSLLLPSCPWLSNLQLSCA